jgi:hypothetical protein
MSLSKCGQCGSNHFEVVHTKPDNSKSVLNFVQCKFCHSVLGTMDFYDLGYRLKLQDDVLIKLAEKLGVSADELR